MPFDPISLISGGLQAATGLIQSAVNAPKAKRATNAYESFVNSQKPNQSILDYYDKALQKYDTNPYNSISYNNATKTNNRTFASGLNSLQNYRQAGSNIAKLTQQNYDANARAAAQAEQMQNQNLSQLGTAAERQGQELNRITDMKGNLLGAKAAQYNKTTNTGISNLYNGLSNLSTGYTEGDGSGGNPYKKDAAWGSKSGAGRIIANPQTLPYR